MDFRRWECLAPARISVYAQDDFAQYVPRGDSLLGLSGLRERIFRGDRNPQVRLLYGLVQSLKLGRSRDCVVCDWRHPRSCPGRVDAIGKCDFSTGTKGIDTALE